MADAKRGLKGIFRRWATSPTTPRLAEFVPVYEQDDNAWWVLEAGHHQNLFDEAVELLDEVADWVDWAYSWPVGKFTDRRDFALGNIGVLARTPWSGSRDETQDIDRTAPEEDS